MANWTGPLVVGLALIAATTSAEIVEEERFDLAPHSEMSASDEGDLNISSFEWVSFEYGYENPPLLIAVFEDDDVQPSALPSEAMIDDSLSLLPFTDDEHGVNMEQQQQLQAP